MHTGSALLHTWTPRQQLENTISTVSEGKREGGGCEDAITCNFFVV